eukprot:gene6079-biopygen8857
MPTTGRCAHNRQVAHNGHVDVHNGQVCLQRAGAHNRQVTHNGICPLWSTETWCMFWMRLRNISQLRGNHALAKSCQPQLGNDRLRYRLVPANADGPHDADILPLWHTLGENWCRGRQKCGDSARVTHGAHPKEDQRHRRTTHARKRIQSDTLRSSTGVTNKDRTPNRATATQPNIAGIHFPVLGAPPRCTKLPYFFAGARFARTFLDISLLFRAKPPKKSWARSARPDLRRLLFATSCVLHASWVHPPCILGASSAYLPCTWDAPWMHLACTLHAPALHIPCICRAPGMRPPPYRGAAAPRPPRDRPARNVHKAGTPQEYQ